MDRDDDADGAKPTARRRRRDADGAVGGWRTEQEPRVEHGARHRRTRAATGDSPEPRDKPRSGRRRKETRCLHGLIWTQTRGRGEREQRRSVSAYAPTRHTGPGQSTAGWSVCAHIAPMPFEPADRNGASHHQDHAAPNDVEFAFWVRIRGLGWNSRFPPDGGWSSGKAAGNHEKVWNSRKWRGIQLKSEEFHLYSGIRFFFLINAVPAPTAVLYTTPRA